LPDIKWCSFFYVEENGIFWKNMSKTSIYNSNFESSYLNKFSSKIRPLSGFFFIFEDLAYSEATNGHIWPFFDLATLNNAVFGSKNSSNFFFLY